MESAQEILNKLRAQTAEKKRSIDLTVLERQHFEFKNELLLKRDQVVQLKHELDAANLKNHELTKSLEKTKTVLEESQFNLNLMMKTRHNLEDRLRETKEALQKSEIQQQMALTEKESLKEYVDKIFMEKYELTRKVEELESRHKYDAAFQNELMKREAKIKTAMVDLQNAVEKCLSEKEQLIAVHQHTDRLLELNEKSREFVAQNEKLKADNMCLEDELIKLRAKCEKFEEFFKSHSESSAPNLTGKLILVQWKTSMSYFKEQLTTKNSTINKLIDQLTAERRANKRLFELLEEKEKLISQSSTKVTEACSETCEQPTVRDGTVMQVKTEVVEIDD